MQRYTVIVHPNRSKDHVQLQNEKTLSVDLAVAPVEGKANSHLICILSKFFRKKNNQIYIIGGLKSRQKVVEVW